MPNQIITEESTLETTLTLWAVPKSRWSMEEDPSQFPFDYQICVGDNKPFSSSKVNVASMEWSHPIPGGVDLLPKAVETLEASKKDAFTQYHDTIRELDAQLNALKLLASPEDMLPIDDDVIEGEVE